MQAFKVFHPRNGHLMASIFHKKSAQGVEMGRYILPVYGMFFVFDTLENAERWTKRPLLRNMELQLWEVDSPEIHPITWEAVYPEHFDIFWTREDDECSILVRRPPAGTRIVHAMQLLHQIW